MTQHHFVKIGLIGYPVAHSRSPELHNRWLAEAGIRGEYRAISCSPDELAQTIQWIKADGYRGFNVTIPHKETVMFLCDHVDDLAKRVGAVNTVVIDSQAQLHGTNTDVYGFIQNIRESVPDFHFSGTRAVVIGAGGAARAAVHGLLEEACASIILTNRTHVRAEEVAQSSHDPARVHVVDWSNRHQALADCDLLVNTTALGMVGKDPLDLDLTALPHNAVVNDIVYNPLMTSLLMCAQQRGNPIVTGIGMLTHQARRAFDLWMD